MKYKLNSDIMLVTVLDESMLVDVNDAEGKIKDMRSVNDVGAYFWKQLEKCMDTDEVITNTMHDYDVTEERAKSAFTDFFFALRDVGYLTVED